MVQHFLRHHRDELEIIQWLRRRFEIDLKIHNQFPADNGKAGYSVIRRQCNSPGKQLKVQIKVCLAAFFATRRCLDQGSRLKPSRFSAAT